MEWRFGVGNMVSYGHYDPNKVVPKGLSWKNLYLKWVLSHHLSPKYEVLIILPQDKLAIKLLSNCVTNAMTSKATLIIP